jgi:hypothetical protein
VFYENKNKKKEHGALKLRPSLWNLHPHDIGHFDGVGRSKKFTRPISAADRPLRVVYIHRGKIFLRGCGFARSAVRETWKRKRRVKAAREARFRARKRPYDALAIANPRLSQSVMVPARFGGAASGMMPNQRGGFHSRAVTTHSSSLRSDRSLIVQFY